MKFCSHSNYLFYGWGQPVLINYRANHDPLLRVRVMTSLEELQGNSVAAGSFCIISFNIFYIVLTVDMSRKLKLHAFQDFLRTTFVTVHDEPSVKSHIANSCYISNSNNNPIHTSNNSKVQRIITPLLDIV